MFESIAPHHMNIRALLGNTARAWFTLLSLVACAIACSPRPSAGGTGSSTNFLDNCSSDAECGSGLSCICQVCTRACTDVSECTELSESVVCAEPGSSPYACGTAEPRVCANEASPLESSAQDNAPLDSDSLDSDSLDSGSLDSDMAQPGTTADDSFELYVDFYPGVSEAGLPELLRTSSDGTNFELSALKSFSGYVWGHRYRILAHVFGDKGQLVADEVLEDTVVEPGTTFTLQLDTSLQRLNRTPVFTRQDYTKPIDSNVAGRQFTYLNDSLFEALRQAYNAAVVVDVSFEFDTTTALVLSAIRGTDVASAAAEVVADARRRWQLARPQTYVAAACLPGNFATQSQVDLVAVDGTTIVASEQAFSAGNWEAQALISPVERFFSVDADLLNPDPTYGYFTRVFSFYQGESWWTHLCCFVPDSTDLEDCRATAEEAVFSD